MAVPATPPDDLHVNFAAVVLNLKMNGISCEAEENPAAHALLLAMQERSRYPGFLSVRSLMVEKVENNIVVRSLLNRLVLQDFGNFLATMETMFMKAKVSAGGGKRGSGPLCVRRGGGCG